MTDNASIGCWGFFVDILWVTDRSRHARRAKSLTFSSKTGLSPRMPGVENFYDCLVKNGNTHSIGLGLGNQALSSNSISAFCACRRFSASCQMTESGASMSSAVISSPR